MRPQNYGQKLSNKYNSELTYFESLPWQATSKEVHEHVPQSF